MFVHLEPFSAAAAIARSKTDPKVACGYCQPANEPDVLCAAMESVNRHQADGRFVGDAHQINGFWRPAIDTLLTFSRGLQLLWEN